MSDEIKVDKPLFNTWNTDAEFAHASKEANRAIQATQAFPRIGVRSVASISNQFQNIDGISSVRGPFNRSDYEFFRPNEQMPRRFRDIMLACNAAYQKVALVRQIVDLMGDFCAGGIELFHPNKSIERFYKTWFKHVNGPERSERLANLIYRVGNVVIKRNTAITKDEVTSDWKRNIAEENPNELLWDATDAKTDLKMPDTHKLSESEIPIRYTFLNPVILEVIGEEMAAFTGKVHYALKLPYNIYRSLNVPLTSFDPAILTEGLPLDIQGALDKNDRYLVLDSDKLINCHYKKDDWDVWAYPMLYSILDDLMLFQKMKLADMTALDGVISHIRVWKLGSLEHKLMPTDAAVNKLAGVLLNHMAGGAIDLIWGPDLTIEETSTEVYKFLGGEKYESVMAHIHSGLGVPSSLSGDKGSFSDNFLSLRTLIERLEYGRDILKRFWENEIRLVQTAMGFRYPAQVTFSNINLHDEQAEKALWIQLVDRGLISKFTLQEKFDIMPEIEEIRLSREKEDIKIGPYTDGEPDLSLKKIALQRGIVTPTEVGLELDDKKSGEKNAIEMQGKIQLDAIKLKPPSEGPVGVGGQGRPKNKKDSSKRKPRTTKPRSTAEEDGDAKQFMSLVLHANQLQKCISDIVNPFYLDKFNKKNMRQLTSVQEKEMEDFKFTLLFNCGTDGSAEDVVVAALAQPIIVYNYIEESYVKLIAEFTNLKKEKAEASSVNPTYEELKQMRNYLYATFKGNY